MYVCRYVFTINSHQYSTQLTSVKNAFSVTLGIVWSMIPTMHFVSTSHVMTLYDSTNTMPF